MSASLAAYALPIFVIRVLSPALIFLTTCSLIFTHPPTPSSPSPITPVVVATHVPRRAFILTFLSLISLSYLCDGLTLAIYAVLDKQWPRHTGLEINAILGLVAFAGLAALGAWKDVQGVEVWSTKKIKSAIAAALCLDIALVVLLGVSSNALKNSKTSQYLVSYTPYLSASPTGPVPPHIPENPPILPIQALLHFAFPTFRALLLVPLLGAILLPRTIYTAIQSDGVETPIPTSSSFLLATDAGAQPSTGLSAVPGMSGDASKYGTFHVTRSNLQRSAPTTRPPTPSPWNAGDSKVSSLFLLTKLVTNIFLA